MNKKQIILIGGGGHCKSCIEVIESEGVFEIVGIIDSKDKIGDLVLGYRTIGCDADLPQLREKYDYALITVGQIKTSEVRTRLFHLLNQLQFKLPVITASSAVVSKHSKIQKGTIIMHQALVNAGATIGENCIINTKALIEHDCIIGNHSHISTNVTLNGNITVGNDCFIGSNACLSNGISVSDNAIIGTNSLLRAPINTAGTYVGNPIRKINR